MLENKSNASSPPATIAATGGQVGDVRIAEPAQFRMVLMSFLAARDWAARRLIAFALYKLIGLFTNIFFYHRFAADFLQRAPQSSWAVGDSDSGDWRNHRRLHGEVRDARRSKGTAFPRPWKRCW